MSRVLAATVLLSIVTTGCALRQTYRLVKQDAGRKSDLAPWDAGAEINRDGDLRLQYLAGWGIDSSLEDYIYRQMLSYRRPPWNLFVGSAERVQSLLDALSAEGGGQ